MPEVTGSIDSPRRWRGLLIAIGVALLAAVGGLLPLLGIPGALIYESAMPVLKLVFGPEVRRAIPADASWPLAILLTLLWPISIVAGYALIYFPQRSRGWWRHLAFLAMLYGWGVAISIWATGSILKRW